MPGALSSGCACSWLCMSARRHDVLTLVIIVCMCAVCLPDMRYASRWRCGGGAVNQMPRVGPKGRSWTTPQIVDHFTNCGQVHNCGHSGSTEQFAIVRASAQSARPDISVSPRVAAWPQRAGDTVEVLGAESIALLYSCPSVRAMTTVLVCDALQCLAGQCRL